MSRGYNAIGVMLAGLCGSLISKSSRLCFQKISLSSSTVYTTFQPELENQKAERLGEFQHKRPPRDKVISEAITSDLREAKQQVTQPGGFAWGIRQMIFGKDGSKERPNVAPASNDSEKEESETTKDR